MPVQAGDARVVWRFSDGKPGHDAQSLGLVRALQARAAMAVYTLPAGARPAALGGWLSGRYAPGRHLPAPDLLVGAGHATHWSLLAARRAFGGKAVVLMRPGLPNSLFDLCLIPAHDAPRPAANVLVTTGALNAMTPRPQRHGDAGLILLGGPSPHYDWRDDGVLAQMTALRAARPELRWRVLASRRTPASMLDALRAREGFERLAGDSPDAFAGALYAAREVRVTEDSVSMVYEALTSGAPTGLLEVARRAASRVSRGIDALVERGWVAAPGDWNMPDAAPPLDEAGRCADWIMTQWLNVN